MGVLEVKFNPPVNKNTQKRARVSRGRLSENLGACIRITLFKHKKYWAIFE